MAPRCSLLISHPTIIIFVLRIGILATPFSNSKHDLSNESHVSLMCKNYIAVEFQEMEIIIPSSLAYRKSNLRKQPKPRQVATSPV